MTAETPPLWTGAAAAAAVRGTFQGSEPAGLTGVSIDTRTLAPGDLFVALDGPNRDGHDFVAAALAAGAGAALVARRPADVNEQAPLLLVDKTQAGLERLGRAARRRSPAKVAAITGSVGKTGTKEMLALALSASGATHRSAASYNNLWGVPLSLARMPASTVYAVFEIGMNHAGEIAPLSRLVAPDVAIVTNVEAAHLEFFSSIEAIADAKAEIFGGVKLGGIAILNADHPLTPHLAQAARSAGIAEIIQFGASAQAQARLIRLDADGNGSKVEAMIAGRAVRYRLHLPGRHLVQNSLAALAAVAALGADPVAGAALLSQFDGVAGRGRRLTVPADTGTATLIDESYNASPASMRAAIDVLAAAPVGPGGRRIAVLGDMLELGDTAPALHRELATSLGRIDLVFACGPLMQTLFEALPEANQGAWAADAASLASVVAAALRDGDIVMVKGSKGSRMADIVSALAAPEP